MPDDFLRPGTRVRLDALDAGSEYGVVAHCWFNDEISGYDCYVVFFGEAFPDGPPARQPYLLRYAARSLTIAPDVLE